MDQEAATTQVLAAVCELGPVCHCNREHLGTSDKGLILVPFDAAQARRDGRVQAAARGRPGARLTERMASWSILVGDPGEDALRQQQYERGQPQAVAG